MKIISLRHGVTAALAASFLGAGLAIATPASADSGEGWVCLNYKFTNTSWTASCTVDNGYQARAVGFCGDDSGARANIYGQWVGAGYYTFGIKCPSGYWLGGGDTESRRV